MDIWGALGTCYAKKPAGKARRKNCSKSHHGVAMHFLNRTASDIGSTMRSSPNSKIEVYKSSVEKMMQPIPIMSRLGLTLLHV